MPIHTAIMIFAGDKNGWSELWYLDVSTIAAGLDRIKNLAVSRQSLLGKGCRVEAVRVGTTQRPWKSQTQAVPTGPPITIPAADTAWNTVLGRVYDATQDFGRVVQLRGVRDVWIAYDDTTGLPKPPTDNGLFMSYWNTYVTALKTGIFKFKVRKADGGFETLTDVTAFSRGADGRLTFQAAGLGSGPNELVTFSGVTGLMANVYSKGRHKVKSNAAGTVVTDTILPAEVNPSLWSAGKVRRYDVDYKTVEFGEPLRYSHRDTGRRFFVTRGRAPKRRPLPG